jgi:hypothetical protein
MAAVQAGPGNGAASTIPAYYDGELFKIQFVEFSGTHTAATVLG